MRLADGSRDTRCNSQMAGPDTKCVYEVMWMFFHPKSQRQCQQGRGDVVAVRGVPRVPCHQLTCDVWEIVIILVHVTDECCDLSSDACRSAPHSLQ